MIMFTTQIRGINYYSVFRFSFNNLWHTRKHEKFINENETKYKYYFF